jgi:uncharacterized membrane protein YjgN (DUF898 family)
MTSPDAPAAQIALAEAAAAAAAAAPVPSVRPAAPDRPVRFTGTAGAFWRILLRGAVLLAVTLGIYRFWLATDVRRFLWSHTEIAGESLEYNGTAAELLIGFLSAIAILVPINLIFFLLALTLGSAGESVGLLAFPALFVLGQFAVYRARRYRLTRTVLRGIRFHQTGSAWRYAFCASFWWIVVPLTLGLAYPFMQANLERYKMRNTFYGDLGARFDGSGWRLFARGIWMWLMVMAPFVIGIVAFIGAMDWQGFGEAISGGESAMAKIIVSDGFKAAIAFGVGGIAVSILSILLLYPIFQAMVLRWWLDGIRFGELTLHSRLRKRTIYGAYLRFLGWSLLFMLALMVISFILLAAFGFSPSGARTEIAGTIASVALYVVMMLGFSTLYQGTVRFTLWRHGTESLDIHGLAVLDTVKAAGEASSAVGEGLADALNTGGI